MVNFSYAVRVFKAELQSFLDPLVEGVSRPVAKLFFDLVYGVMRSGSTLVSMVARSVSPDGRIKTAECRLGQGEVRLLLSRIRRSGADRGQGHRGEGAYPRGALQAGFGGEGDTGPQHVKDDTQGKGQIEEETYPTYVGYRLWGLTTF